MMMILKERQEFRNKIKSLETQFVIIELAQIKQRIYQQIEQAQALGQEPRIAQ